MEKISILYHPVHLKFLSPTIGKARELEKKLGMEIKLDISENEDLLGKVRKNPNYDFIVIHVDHDEDARNWALECRRISNATITAESFCYPNGKSDLMHYFDDYSPALMYHMENLIVNPPAKNPNPGFH